MRGLVAVVLAAAALAAQSGVEPIVLGPFDEVALRLPSAAQDRASGFELRHRRRDLVDSKVGGLDGKSPL